MLHMNGIPRQLRTGIIFVSYVTSVSCQAVIAHISRKGEYQDYDPRIVVFGAELFKLSIAYAFFHFNRVSEISPRRLFLSASPMLVPALLYFIMNSLYFVVIGNMSPSGYTIISQIKHLITALLSWTFLSKRFSVLQWKALLLLSVGAALVQLKPTSQDHGEISMRSFLLGPCLLVMQCFLSGFAGIYFEKVLKQNTPDISIWARNIQLSVATLFLGLVSIYLSPPSPSSGNFQPIVFVLMFNSGLSGILIALLVLYADNVVKNIGGTVSVVLTAVLDFVLFKSNVHPTFILGSIVVFTSVSIYQDPVAVIKEKRVIPVEKIEPEVTTVDQQVESTTIELNGRYKMKLREMGNNSEETSLLASVA